MSLLYLGGRAEKNSEEDLLLKDNLQSMGSAVTQTEGSLAWCEAVAIMKCQAASLNFIRLLSYQLTPNTISVFARRLAAIYGMNATGTNPIPSNLMAIQTQIGLKNALFGTPNSFINVSQYISAVLGQIYLDIEFAPELQPMATQGPLAVGQSWFSPLSLMYVRIWQPRDNLDNFLMPTNVFQNTKNTYKSFVQDWLPAYAGIANKQLLYFGANGTITSNTNISGTLGTNTITCGGGGAFTTDLSGVNLNGWQMPIEVVADDNKVYTYHVASVVDDNHLITVEPILATFTGRTYRLLGIQMDVGPTLDGAELFSI